MTSPQAPVSRSSGNALLAGASGLVGSHCLRLLLDSRYYAAVLALGRRPLPFEHPKLHQLTVSFDSLPSLQQCAGADIFCALGTTMKKAGSRQAFRKVDFDYPLAFGRHAADGGARQFLLVSSIGADPHSTNFYLRVKGELEEALKTLPFHALHLFRPSFLMGERVERRFAERFGVALASSMEFTFVGPVRRYRPIRAEEVAKAMLAAARLVRPGAHTYEYEQIRSLARV
jgi:uncharacterized protein YbjT (DUF2867 family)